MQKPVDVIMMVWQQRLHVSRDESKFAILTENSKQDLKEGLFKKYRSVSLVLRSGSTAAYLGNSWVSDS